MTLLLAIGLAIALEGAAYALFPEAMKRTIDLMFAEGVDRVRILGAVSFFVGAVIVLATLQFS